MKELNTSTVEKTIKEGSKVMFKDGSFTLSIKKDEFKLAHDFLGLNNEVWTVVAVNVPCPTDQTGCIGALTYLNNCIVKNDNGDIVFCSICNIRNTEYLF